MSEFVVYGVPGSPYVRAALLGLEEKGAPYRIQPLGMGENKSPAYLKRHHFGRIPFMQHGDFGLYEVQAILRYLDRIIPEPALAPKDPRAEARMNQLCGVTDWYVMPDVSAGITFGRLVAPKFGMPVDEAKIAAAVPRAAVCMTAIDELMGESPYLAGETVSIADLMLAPQMAFLKETREGETLLAPYPHLQAWIARMNDRPSMKATTWERVAEMAKAA